MTSSAFDPIKDFIEINLNKGATSKVNYMKEIIRQQRSQDQSSTIIGANSSIPMKLENSEIKKYSSVDSFDSTSLFVEPALIGKKLEIRSNSKHLRNSGQQGTGFEIKFLESLEEVDESKPEIKIVSNSMIHKTFEKERPKYSKL